MAVVIQDPLTDRLLASTGLINALLISATAVAGAIVLIKFLTKKHEFKVFGVDLDIGRVWIIFGLFTIGHAYCSYVFQQDCIQVFK
jgi:hypothetical protein